MGVFGFLKGNKKKEKTNPQQSLFNPVSGEVVAIEEVEDPVFSQKMMGDGFGVIPNSEAIYAPSNGKVVSVFPTQHAVGLELDNGVEVLVHIGIDTVELEGGPFETLVKEGDKVTPETKISTVDLNGLESAGKTNTIIIVFTNMDQVKDYQLTKSGESSQGDELGTVTGSSNN